MIAKKVLGKRYLSLVLAGLVLFAFIGLGCDGGITSGVCTENVAGVVGTLNAKLYYPCNISSPTGATTMTGGFMETLSNVDWLSRDVAQSGYVVLAFTPTNIMGMVSGWKIAHKNCISRLKAINTSHRKLRGMIDTSKMQTCGHSKGGGSALWASAELGSQLKTTIGMAPWMEGFTPLTLQRVSAATLIQAGSIDSLAVGPMTLAEYGGLGNIPKCYKTYPGYGHMAWFNATGAQAANLSGDVIRWMHYYLDGQGSAPCSGMR